MGFRLFVVAHCCPAFTALDFRKIWNRFPGCHVAVRGRGRPPHVWLITFFIHQNPAKYKYSKHSNTGVFKQSKVIWLVKGSDFECDLGWYAQFLPKIVVKFLLEKIVARLIFKIMLKSLHIGPQFRTFFSAHKNHIKYYNGGNTEVQFSNGVKTRWPTKGWPSWIHKHWFHFGIVGPIALVTNF